MLSAGTSTVCQYASPSLSVLSSLQMRVSNKFMAEGVLSLPLSVRKANFGRSVYLSSCRDTKSKVVFVSVVLFGTAGLQVDCELIEA